MLPLKADKVAFDPFISTFLTSSSVARNHLLSSIEVVVSVVVVHKNLLKTCLSVLCSKLVALEQNEWNTVKKGIA